MRAAPSPPTVRVHRKLRGVQLPRVVAHRRRVHQSLLAPAKRGRLAPRDDGPAYAATATIDGRACIAPGGHKKAPSASPACLRQLPGARSTWPTTAGLCTVCRGAVALQDLRLRVLACFDHQHPLNRHAIRHLYPATRATARTPSVIPAQSLQTHLASWPLVTGVATHPTPTTSRATCSPWLALAIAANFPGGCMASSRAKMWPGRSPPPLPSLPGSSSGPGSGPAPGPPSMPLLLPRPPPPARGQR